MSRELVGQEKRENTMVGEYIHFQNKLLVKACQSREIFSY